MDKHETAAMLTAVDAARGNWLLQATEVLRHEPRVSGAWLVGSLGRRGGDGYSDVDLIVAVDGPLPDELVADPFGGLGLPGTVLYRRPKPRNAPADGAYLAVCLELAGLPVLVDLFVWPADTAAVPAGAVVLYQRDGLARSSLGFLDLLDQHRTADTRGSDPNDPATWLMLVQLAAKYHARADHHRQTAIHGQLGLADDAGTAELRELLDLRIGADSAVARAVRAVERLLELADAVHERVTPEVARERLVEELITEGFVTRPEVAAAFRAVPRHLFTPGGTDLAAAYANDVVVTKRDPNGKVTSSVSAPWLQAYMLESAELRPGSRVLEVGSGGYNAALIAELVGVDGQVTSVDIDAGVVGHAQAALTSAGYPHVQVLRADAEYGHPAGSPYDAIIVTAETGDIPAAWTDQLTEHGRLVMPLRIRGITRCLTLRPAGDHLVATASRQCGFVALQGDGHGPARRIALRGDDIVLHVDDTTEVSQSSLVDALRSTRVELWSPVTITMTETAAFESLHLWLASQSRPFGALTVDRRRAAGLVDPQDRFSCPTLLSSHSLAYLALRRLDDTIWQVGAHGFGPDAARLADDMNDLVTGWDQEHRHGAQPQIAVYGGGTFLPDIDATRLIVPRRHRLIAVTWPTGNHR